MVALMRCLTRRKRLKHEEKNNTELAKCLTTWDLTSLGIGATLGAGMYVVSGQVAASIAGPAVIISFALAALTSILSGLCYAEFGARVPKTTGSAYAYSYITVGEIWAFIIGWNLILEYMIGTAADARALSACFDYVIGNAIRNLTLTYIGEINTPGLGTYPDILSFIVTIMVTIVLAIGVKQSSTFSTIFNVLNFLVVVFIVIAGIFFVDTRNWTEGRGFFPYGASGVLSGAATCFYAYVGFDIIATTGEETKNAPKSIPIAIVASLVVVFVCYFGVSAIVTLIVPFDQLDKLSPIPNAFAQRGFPLAKYIIGVGAVCGLSSSLLGSQFPLPRIIYAMASDGLLFKFFANVNPRTEVPVLATVYPGLLTAVIALLFDLNELVEMMSIGTLLAYTLVSLCVLILRYQPSIPNDTSIELWHLKNSERYEQFSMYDPSPEDFEISTTGILLTGFITKSDQSRDYDSLQMKKGTSNQHRPDDPRRGPTAESFRIVNWAVALLFVSFVGLCSATVYGFEAVKRHSHVMILFVVIFAVLSMFAIIVILLQPQNTTKISFKAPLVPALPILAVFFNVFLMLKLSRLTWIRFGVWMGLGMLLYFGYSVWNSQERQQMSPLLEQKIFDRQVLLADDPDVIDFGYEMETIPAHRDNSANLSPIAFKWDSL
ncbi:high affinity cationic amino acid transporter 1-like [Montipora foliosa]|uniref:high affinity cationic amino acid transporter 1-like n=1 Tax=Montipora foliosa TaxID=591990 RepID=UPI0035F16C9C